MTLEELNTLYEQRKNITSSISTNKRQTNMEAPIEERFEQYIKDCSNPFQFSCDSVNVIISYTENAKTLNELLKKYFVNSNQ